jgi:hypothetical protein
MGQLTRKKPIREEIKKRGAPSPGPGWPGLGFRGASLAPPLAVAALLLLPGRCPRLAWEGGKGAPSPLYKGGALGGGDAQHTISTSLSHLATSYHLPGAPASPGRRPLPLSLPRGLTKSYVGEGNHHHCTPSCCGVSESPSKAVYLRISAGNGVPIVSMVAVCVRVRGGVARAVPESLLPDLHKVEVGYIIFIINTCAGA